MSGSSNTRQRALDAALELFARKGYEGASMGDIADALGIKAPSLYKYFSGKDQLFAALAPMVREHYTALWDGVGQDLQELEEGLATDRLLRLERLEGQTLAWLRPEMEDARAAALRQLITVNDLAECSPNIWLWSAPLELYQGFFARLIQRETLRRGEPRVMAVEFLAPLFQLLAFHDRAPDYADWDWQEEAAAHIRQFHRVFAHREPRSGGPSPMGWLFRR